MNQDRTKPRILVVDDDANLLELLVDTLTTIGYRVVGAPGGVEALENLRNDKFDLMITDIKMPDVDGLQLLKKVRRHYSRMPVLFVTGVATPNIIGQAAPDGFLAKPFRITQIENLIEGALMHKPVGYPSKMPRILIVDGDEEFRSMLSDALSYAQYLPFHVADARAALQQLDDGTINALIVDCKILAADSGDLVKLAREKHPEILTVLTGTREATETQIPIPQVVETDAFLQKPFKASDLLGLLSDHGLARPLS
jgi:DNA-binding NtrC family response regulator